jgi:ATP-dependent helicase Lhr and Lhr-like helicase
VTGVARLHPGLLHHVVNTLGWSSLRPLQAAAVDPLLDGQDALLLAPTAGGKTEAAIFPTLTAMADRDWKGLSVLYVCPLRALLNNLHPRISGYAGWLGRTAGLWHGDTTAGERRRVRREPPDLLLTTPESVESMLVSTLTDPRQFFADVRTVIVDEVHAFAGDDRGWHLLAVLERLSRLAGRSIQRIGLSATVGNPDALLRWLQGAASASRPGVVLAADAVAAGVNSNPAEVGLDYVGSVDNAATVVAALHAGEKRLVFCESRSQAEQLALALRTRQVRTFVSHSSLSADERRQAEHAFAEARDCVIVATSTLELGVDVGDLDRVIQLDAPATVASFLQRLGRTGRRAGAGRSMLFLATREAAALHAAGLLRLWQEGFIEPVSAPPAPRHIAAQQLLALCLQEKRVGRATWHEWYGDIGLFDDTTPEIVNWLVYTGHLDSDEGMLFIGPEAERRFGRRNFMDLLTVFAAAPEFTVLYGRQQLGSTDALMLMTKVDGPRVISLGGRTWRVTHVDWSHHRCYVDATDGPGRSLWQGPLPPHSYRLAQAQREVLLGADPDVDLSRRAVTVLASLRNDAGRRAWQGGTVVERWDDQLWWWTWAGARANATLAAALPDHVEVNRRIDNYRLRLRPDTSADQLRTTLDDVAAEPLPPPLVTPDAVEGLKFGDVLPPHLAMNTLATRMTDRAGAAHIVAAGVRWVLRG